MSAVVGEDQQVRGNQEAVGALGEVAQRVDLLHRGALEAVAVLLFAVVCYSSSAAAQAIQSPQHPTYCPIIYYLPKLQLLQRTRNGNPTGLIWSNNGV